ncbi:MAG: lipid-binding SYLF domain-containing protein [Gammaproteobacteria bacterium]|nr:lipid-binding SYLF domain-containing protein [Gammaproteobacteria bacterium]
MKKYIVVLRMLLSVCLLIAPLSATNAGWNPFDDKTKDNSTNDKGINKTITSFKKKDADLKRFFADAYGYAVFPTVAKAGMGIGGAYGKGKVYRRGSYIGDTSLTQLTIGFQLGGQTYSEIIFFGTKAALNEFMRGEFEFNAQISAVAVTAGASADVDYNHGVAVFTVAKGGLMYEASVGGQKFTFSKK